MILLGIDPGLQKTGWAVVRFERQKFSYIDGGVIKSDAKQDMAARLLSLHAGLTRILDTHRPDSVAIEETFMNNNARSALKLGQARGALIVAAASHGLDVREYPPNSVKKAVVGAGHADKAQIGHMIRILVANVPDSCGEDEADAIALAICHAHHTPLG